MAFFLWKHEQTRQVFLGFVCLKKRGGQNWIWHQWWVVDTRKFHILNLLKRKKKFKLSINEESMSIIKASPKVLK